MRLKFNWGLCNPVQFFCSYMFICHVINNKSLRIRWSNNSNKTNPHLYNKMVFFSFWWISYLLSSNKEPYILVHIYTSRYYLISFGQCYCLTFSFGHYIVCSSIQAPLLGSLLIYITGRRVYYFKHALQMELSISSVKSDNLVAWTHYSKYLFFKLQYYIVLVNDHLTWKGGYGFFLKKYSDSQCC